MKFLKQKNVLLKIVPTLMLFFVFLSPVFVALAAGGSNLNNSGSNTTGSGSNLNNSGSNLNNSGSNVDVSVKIENPLSNEIDTLPKFIEVILNIVMIIGVPLVALAIIYTGFLFVKAQGNPEEISKAKTALTYTLIGAALLLGSWVLANAIQGTIIEINRTT